MKELVVVVIQQVAFLGGVILIMLWADGVFDDKKK